MHPLVMFVPSFYKKDTQLHILERAFPSLNHLKFAYDREQLALVLALQKWKHYLLGKYFFVKIDQSHMSISRLSIKV